MARRFTSGLVAAALVGVLIVADSAAADDQGRWDFYLGRVEGSPASITLDLQWRSRTRPPGARTLYWASLEMKDRAEHGIGSAAESTLMVAAEEAIDMAAVRLGLIPVGRLRSDGDWLLSFYGPPGQEQLLSRSVAAAAGRAGRRFKVGSQPDESWSYYDGVLFPDEERWQWMLNRSVVESLARSGDPLTEARRVDHWAYFAKPAGRARFAEAAARMGFATAEERDDAQPPRPHALRIHRVERVSLEEIHATVMELRKLAESHDGDYDGWETGVKRAATGP